MTCAKIVVKCKITSKCGKEFIGENHCQNPQPKCPRNDGEGYEKCKSICLQGGHAEIDAINKAVGYTEGATAELSGHNHFCRECQLALFGAGVKYLTIKEYG